MNNAYCQNNYCAPGAGDGHEESANDSFSETILHVGGFCLVLTLSAAMIWFTYLG